MPIADSSGWLRTTISTPDWLASSPLTLSTSTLSSNWQYPCYTVYTTAVTETWLAPTPRAAWLPVVGDLVATDVPAHLAQNADPVQRESTRTRRRLARQAAVTEAAELRAELMLRSLLDDRQLRCLLARGYFLVEAGGYQSASAPSVGPIDTAGAVSTPLTRRMLAGRELLASIRGERRVYRITRGEVANIHQLDGSGEAFNAWCVHPAGNLPIADIMAAQKLALEHDDLATLAIANRHPVSPRWTKAERLARRAVQRLINAHLAAYRERNTQEGARRFRDGLAVLREADRIAADALRQPGARAILARDTRRALLDVAGSDASWRCTTGRLSDALARLQERLAVQALGSRVAA